MPSLDMGEKKRCLETVSSAIFYDVCSKCDGDLVSSVTRCGLLEACCLDCDYEPIEEEYKVICEKENTIG